VGAWGHELSGGVGAGVCGGGGGGDGGGGGMGWKNGGMSFHCSCYHSCTHLNQYVFVI
jgi:hypothetical protein